MKILNSQLTDLSKIFELYGIATEYMKLKNQVAWPVFSEELITTEIEEGHQWKIEIENEIACIWATTLEDKLIWGSKNEPSIYIHRIAVNPDFRGKNYVGTIVDWAKQYGRNNNLLYIRLDTVGLNKGLIAHYQKHGFEFLGAEELVNTDGLPDHYNKGKVCLFQQVIL